MRKTLLGAAASLFCVANVSAVDFGQNIRPILSGHCFQCHGPDEENRTAELRLDAAEGVEYAFASGATDESEAWRRINSDDPEEQMPPPDIGKPLTAAQISLIRQWMDEGAPWSQHWAFVTPVRPKLPTTDNALHPIDQFVFAKLRNEGLHPSPEASRETLIRRLKFDLLGLPPALDEIDAFLSDRSPDAYEQLVDRLLSSPHYGERMGTVWLDGARYADTNGYQNDFQRSMWPWRDWVIDAFNDNMPFDQFTIEQLAGDLLPEPSLQQRVATGFNRNHRMVTEAGSIPEEWLVENVVDRVETTSTVFLGLTLGCARCHDHKYDPISQREFYQFFSFFHNVKELGVYQERRGNVAPVLRLMPPEERRRLDDLEDRVTAAESIVKQLESEVPSLADGWSLSDLQQPTPLDRPTSKFRLELAGDAKATLPNGTRRLPDEEFGQPLWTEGVFGRVARFTGPQSLSYGQAVAPDHEDRFTFTFWIKPLKEGAVVDKMEPENFSRGFDIYWKKSGQLEVHLIHNWPGSSIKVSTPNNDDIPKDRWSHVGLSYDGSSKATGIRLVVNNRPISMKTEFDQLRGSIASDQPFRIAHVSRGQQFTGSLTDVRFHEELLADSTIAAIANEGLTRIFSEHLDTGNEALRKERGLLFANFANNAFVAQLRERRDSLKEIQREKSGLENAYPTVMVMEELPVPRKTFVLTRGEYHSPDKTQPVSADVPQFLRPLPEGVKKDRLALAKWIVAAENPLTARVMVNRIWQVLFGIGLVKTSENFGIQAEPPSHPELLDWLATEFVESGWDVKRLLKLIVTSATYRQSSVNTPDLLSRDPSNRLLARGPRFRLPAEHVRDNALAVSGLLTAKIGGPSIKPYQPEGLWDELAGGAGEGKYEQTRGEDLYRRSFYVYRKRTVPHPTMTTFDAPSFEVCQVKRSRTNTPLQALALLNDVTYVEAARKLGERMLTEGGKNDWARLSYGFRLVTGRRPAADELETLLNGCDRRRKLFADDPDAAKRFISHGESKTTIDVPFDQLAAYTAVASILLNLDETVTKE